MIERYELWGHVWREWGYEIRIDFYMDDGSVHHRVMSFENIPTDEELQSMIDDIGRNEILIDVISEGY